MGKIKEVILGNDYVITVRFDNNNSVDVDMKSRLHTARFSELRDYQVFSALQTDGKAVHWPGGISVSISELMEIVIR